MNATEETVHMTGMPRIGDPAPSFTAATTQGDINFPADYLGRWVILFSHPADFTPVCTTEFMTFATMQNEFTAYNTKLVGLSVDGLYSHIAWLRTIKEKIAFNGMRDVDVTFPLIDDVSMQVARRYGMIMPACLRLLTRFGMSSGAPATNAARYPARLDCLLSEYTLSRPVMSPPLTRGSSTDGTGSPPRWASHAPQPSSA